MVVFNRISFDLRAAAEDCQATVAGSAGVVAGNQAVDYPGVGTIHQDDAVFGIVAYFNPGDQVVGR